jgi:hypothetical protein
MDGTGFESRYGKKFSSIQTREHRLWSPPSLLFNWYRCSVPKIKWSEREVNHSPPTRVEVKKEWSHTSIPPTCLDDIDRNFTLYSFYDIVYSYPISNSIQCVIKSSFYVLQTQFCTKLLTPLAYPPYSFNLIH